MKVNINYKGKSVELEIPDEKLEELVKEQKKTGWEKPEWNEPYWFINASGVIVREVWTDNAFDNAHYERGNIFMNKELAENIARYTSLDLRIRRRIAEICEPVELNNINVDKWSIGFDSGEMLVTCFRWSFANSSAWNCDTKAHAEQIIEEFKDELTWYFTEFKDRMDG